MDALGTQLSLSCGREPLDRGAWLRLRLGRPAVLTWTDNRRTMVSASGRGGVLRVRVHRGFSAADEPVWEALADYLQDIDAPAPRLLRQFAASLAAPGPPRRKCAQGRHHDLGILFARLNRDYFHGRCRSAITWGRRERRAHRRRSMQLGSYVRRDGLIRIHPALDQGFVPEYFVAWVVFHEMLHEVFGERVHGGRRTAHPPEFLALEATYPDHDRCMSWQHAHLDRLLRY